MDETEYNIRKPIEQIKQLIPIISIEALRTIFVTTNNASDVILRQQIDDAIKDMLNGR